MGSKYLTKTGNWRRMNLEKTETREDESLNPERREEIIKISHFSIAELKNSATKISQTPARYIDF
jgi:hypothetical protein